MRILLSVFFLLLPQIATAEVCENWSQKKLGKIDSKKIDESSGIVASRTMNDVFWTHNDSSGNARIFAINSKGKLLAKFDIEDAKAVDWEDIAIAPCRELGDEFTKSDCLYIGDIGNNTTKRDKFNIYVVEEPTFDVQDNPIVDTLELLHRIKFEYKKKARNSEAFFIHEGSAWIFDKGNATDLYRLKLDKKVAKHISERTKVEHVTGADINEEGTAFLLRDHDHAFLFDIREDEDIEDAYDRKPLKIKLRKEERGEAIAWVGSKFITSNEGVHSRLRQYSCSKGKDDSAGVDNTEDIQLSGGGCATAYPLSLSPYFLIFSFVFLWRKRI